jgi:type I restriction enzyme R subunit
MATAEQRARATIDKLLEQAGWSIQDFKSGNLHAARGVALRKFERALGHGTAVYTLSVDSNAAQAPADVSLEAR